MQFFYNSDILHGEGRFFYRNVRFVSDRPPPINCLSIGNPDFVLIYIAQTFTNYFFFTIGGSSPSEIRSPTPVQKEKSLKHVNVLCFKMTSRLWDIECY